MPGVLAAGIRLCHDRGSFVNGNSVLESRSWPNLAMIAGGLLMIPMWVRYTTLHGPTTVDEGGHWLGQGPGFWGSMMEGPAGLLIAAGAGRVVSPANRERRSDGSRRLRARHDRGGHPTGGRPGATRGHSAAVGPSLRSGVDPDGSGQSSQLRVDEVQSARTRGAWGTLLSSFLWALLVRPDLTDRIDGYRIYGVVANALVGLGWVVFGVSLARHPAAEPAPPTAPEAA